MAGAQLGIRSPALGWRPSTARVSALRASPKQLRQATLGVRSVLQHPGRHEDAQCREAPRPAKAPARTGRRRDEALLCSKLPGAHAASITAILVTSDTAGRKEVVTGSLDKTMALWRFPAEGEEDCAAASTAVDACCAAHAGVQEVVRLNPAGAPIFSLAVDGAAAAGGAAPRRPDERQQVFCGNAAKSVGVWDLPSEEMQGKVVLDGHSGWVRALAAQGRWLFSAGCNTLRQWDLARAVPRHVRDVPLVKGDILGIATRPGAVYTCGADGSIRSWAIDKKGELTQGRAREKAHRDRVSAILAAEGFLYSVSWDGSVKMWDADSLELVMEAPHAHEGKKVHCAAVGPDGNLYTGGDDRMVRRWRLGSLNPAPSDALYCHSHSVRALAAGPSDTLVSGDQAGELAFWRV